MGATAAFDYAAWCARYPELSGVSSPAAQAYFDEASLYWRNDGSGPCATQAQQRALMNMITAHLAKLNATICGVAPSPVVGRVTTATEGSVTVATEYASETPGSMAWYIQTPYGAAFWQATAGFRLGRYRPGLERNMAPWGGGRYFAR